MDPEFSEKWSDNLKRVWSEAPEAIGICIVKHQLKIIHFEHSYVLSKFLTNSVAS